MVAIDLQRIKDSLIETEFPQYVIVEPTNYCNLKCIMCPHEVMPRVKGFMDFELFKKIVDEITLKSPKSKLWPAVLGESLIAGDRFKKMVDYAVGKQVDIVLNTNGTLLNDDWIDYITFSGIKEVILGIDGLTKETYEKVRVNGQHERMRQSLIKLIKSCHDVDGAPSVILQYIVMQENEHEVEDFKTYWLKQGAIVKVRLKQGWGDHISNELPYSHKDRAFPSPWLIRNFLVLWDGTVCQCDADCCEARAQVGNLRDSSIQELWLGELKQRRMRHWQGDFSDALCLTCDDWQVGLSEFYYPDGYKKATMPMRDKANAQFGAQPQKLDTARYE